MSPKDEAVGMAIPDGFRVQESRAAALDGSLVKRGVLVRLRMGWFGGLITGNSKQRFVRLLSCAPRRGPKRA